jgi:hypothetical protein
MRSYNLIKKLLQENPELRNDDKLLQWKVWEIEGSVKNDCMYYSDFKNASNPETLRRTRQKIQELFPELGPTETIKNLRRKRQEQKGTFIYRDNIETRPKYSFNPTTQTYEVN